MARSASLLLTALWKIPVLSELIVKGARRAPEGTSSDGLAALLLEFERTLSADPPDRVVLADDSDESLAAALVAAKLLIELEATASASATTSMNGRLIAQLAGG
jgi:hypothetical protein